MPRLNRGNATQVRARLLLESLLDYVNTLTDSKKLDKKLQVSWEKTSPELFVVCTVKLLVQLTEANKDQLDLTEVQIQESIAFFENHLEILTRPAHQGSGEWRFTLKLWYSDKNKNLIKFDELCQEKQAKKQTSKQIINSSLTPPDAVVHSTQEHSDNLEDALTKIPPSPEKLEKELSEWKSNYRKLKDNFQAQKEANQELKEQIKTANSNLTNALRALIIVIIPIEICTGIIYDHLKDIYQTNNSSESRSANTNNSTSNTSSSNLPDLSKRTNTASSQSQTEKPNSESKPQEKSKCP